MPYPVESRQPPAALHDRAIDNLRYIRETIERASAFTAVPGWGQVIIGATALVAAYLASRQSNVKSWLFVWLVEAVVALLIAGWSLDRKARRTATPLFSGPGRKVACSLSPPLIGCRFLTAVLLR